MPRNEERRKIQREIPPTVIVPEEYEWAIEYASVFRCPKNFDPLNCDGKNCPVRTKPFCYYKLCPYKNNCNGPWAGCYEDYYNDCLEFLKATMIIDKVQKGQIKVHRRPWEVKLE